MTVDESGEHRAGLSGADGSLRVEELRPPYDLRVGDTAWLGVSEPHPVIEVEGEEVLVARSITVEVRAPGCGREICVVDVVTTSPTGHGETTASGLGLVTVEHQSRASMEEIEAHALVHDAAFEHVAYARGVDALEAAPVDTREILLEEGTRVTLDVPGDASFAIASRLPLIEGASWRMARSAAAPPTKELLHRSSRAWSGTQSLDDDPPGLPLPVGPEILRPLAGGALAARGASLSWTPEPRALFTVDVADVERGAFRYRVVTNASDLPFRRLEALGLPRLRPGTHTFALATAPFSSVDDAVSADGVVRGRRFDERRAGAATYETIPFTVSP